MRVLAFLSALCLAATLSAESFEQLRGRVGDREPVVLPQGTTMEGIIVSDYMSHNMETPVQVSFKEVDPGLNFRTAYIQNDDASLGFRVVFNSVYQAVITMITKRPVNLPPENRKSLNFSKSIKEKKMTELEKLFAGINRISDYNIDIDFDNDEISQLLDADIIKASDIGICRASDLLIDGVIDYEQYPFEKFSAYEQIRQLQYCVIEPTEFLGKADLDTFDSDEWLYLLEVLPQITEKAPWDELRKNGSVKSWMDLLKSRPEFAKYASWKTLAEKRES